MTGDPNHNKFIVVRTTARVAEIEADSYEEAAIIGDHLSDDAFKRDDRFDKKYVVCMWLQECREECRLLHLESHGYIERVGGKWRLAEADA